MKGEGHTVIAVICMSFFITGSDEEDEELFSWEEYLKKYHAKAVPKETFKHVSIYLIHVDVHVTVNAFSFSLHVLDTTY